MKNKIQRICITGAALTFSLSACSYQTADIGFTEQAIPAMQRQEESTEAAERQATGKEELQAGSESQTAESERKVLDNPTVPEPVQTVLEPTPKPVADSTQTSERAATAVSTTASNEEVPFYLSRETGFWWQIDSTDGVYWAVRDQINAMRAAGGMVALSMDESLSAIASSRCESFMTGPFDHSGMVTSGEILACGSWKTASAVCSAWQNSPEHYAAIMNPDYTRMGVGCWFLEMNGQQYAYWTVTFE